MAIFAGDLDHDKNPSTVPMAARPAQAKRPSAGVPIAKMMPVQFIALPSLRSLSGLHCGGRHLDAESQALMIAGETLPARAARSWRRAAPVWPFATG